MALSNSKKYLIFGGTGSLGKTLIARLLKENARVIVFSRDEAKHHKINLQYPNVKTIVGDVRSYDSVLRAISDVDPDIVINAAAMKQVPLCEEYPDEAVATNLVGTQNIIKAVESHCKNRHWSIPLKVLSISTDKACKPVNSYGMTKALQERIHLKANKKNHIHNCVRYGNVLESTGSVIPVFKERISKGQKLLVTHPNMTRFLLSLNEAVDLIFLALADDEGGKIFIPKVKSSFIVDLATSLLKANGGSGIEISGIRPGEKMHEILISEEECWRTEDKGNVFVVHDVNLTKQFDHLKEEYSSGSKQCLMSVEETYNFLGDRGAL